MFGLVLEAIAFALLWSTVNLLSACLAVGAMLFYVFVYTIWLKPRTPQNIVIGGAAGAVPVLVGWAAVTGMIEAPAWVLFAIVFFWTPPHFWALALRYRDDYAAAGIPMLPVVKGERVAIHNIVAYSVIVFATSMVLPLVSDVGAIYIVVAVALGAAFVLQAVRLAREHQPREGDQVLHVLEHLPRCPVRSRCRRHPRPQHLTPRRRRRSRRSPAPPDGAD